MIFRQPNLTLICRSHVSRISSNPCGKSSTASLFLLPIDSPSVQNHSRISRRWHFGNSHNHNAGKENESIFRLGLVADISLAFAKSITGYLSGSTAIMADAAHSVSDIVLSGVALWSYRAARAPKDRDHPYGHGKFETLGALGISSMLLVTAGGIAWHALDVLMGLLWDQGHELKGLGLAFNHLWAHGHESHVGHHHGIDMEHPILALNVTLISIGVKEGLYWITKRAGEREGSGLMKANAWHHRADAVSSVVALIGVGGSILGLQSLDPLAGLLVSGMILKAGVENGYQSVMELVDAAVPLHLLAPIKITILQVEGVKGCHRLRGRRAGSSLYLDVHIAVDPFSSVSAAHDIGENVRHKIQKSHSEVAEVFIHIDPALSQCPSPLTNLKGVLQENSRSFSEKQNFEAIISDIFSSKFSEEIAIHRITHHSLQGKILLEVQVSMPLHMSIRDAMEVAKSAEALILQAAPDINGVSIQLRLGHPIPQTHRELVEDNPKGRSHR